MTDQHSSTVTTSVPKVGDFFIARGSWNLKFGEVTKVTEKTVAYLDRSWTKPRERRLNTGDILFTGPETVTKRLRERLESSQQQRFDEERKAADRQRERDERLIADARAALSQVRP